MEANDKKTIRVYYNSACPLCRAGINHQKTKTTDHQVDWNDVHTQAGIHHEVSPDLEFVRKKIHAINEKGEIKIGIEAFEVIWKNSPGERWKAKLVSLPGIKPISILLYDVFASLLYRWNRWKRHW